MKQLFYLAAPYSHPDPAVVKSRIEKLCRIDAMLMEHGIFTVSPLMKHFILDYANIPSDWVYWEIYSRTLISKVNQVIVLMLDGWETSTGVQEEIKLANELGIPIYFIDENSELISTEMSLSIHLHFCKNDYNHLMSRDIMPIHLNFLKENL